MNSDANECCSDAWQPGWLNRRGAEAHDLSPGKTRKASGIVRKKGVSARGLRGQEAGDSVGRRVDKCVDRCG
jgi:hypothetical protein